MVVEMNDDGFTLADVRGLCSSGRSSKDAPSSGFKCAFSVAERAYVQSGVWSFCFEHNRGDDGLGIVTPFVAPIECLPDGVTTRITLHLSNMTPAEYQALISQMTNIPETALFFLRKLRVLYVDVVDSENQTTSVVIRKKGKRTENGVRTSRSSKAGAESEFDKSLYHYVSHMVYDMPQDDRKKDKVVKIELAFPVDIDTGRPKRCELGQYLFSTLPFQRLPHLQVCWSLI